MKSGVPQIEWKELIQFEGKVGEVERKKKKRLVAGMEFLKPGRVIENRGNCLLKVRK